MLLLKSFFDCTSTAEGSGAYDCLNLYRWVLIKNRKKEAVLSERKSKKNRVGTVICYDNLDNSSTAFDYLCGRAGTDSI